MFRILISVAIITLGGLNIVQANSYKEVRDWYVYCTYSLKCSLQTAIESDVAYTFGFEREPKANAEIVPFLSMSAQVTSGSEIKFIMRGVDDTSFVFGADASSREDNTLRLNSPESSQKLVEAMMAGELMTIRIDTDKGTREIDVSLSGVTGGALYMDEIQQRLGNRDALKETGEGEPRDAVTRAAEFNSSGELPKEVVEFWRNYTAECAETYGDEEEDLIKRFGAVRITLEQDAQLFLMPCGLPGAYNYPQSLVMFDTKSKAVRLLSLPVMGQIGPTVMENPYNVNWNDRASTLSAFFKGRGLGDCGSKMSWVLGGEGYYANFELKEAFFKDNCDGNYDDWPQIWPPQ